MFNDPGLLCQALTHSSVACTRLESNERLEFLGDAVLSLVICDKLHQDHCKSPEGQLTKIKSFVVSRHTCAAVSEKLGLDDFLVVGKGFDKPDLPMSLAAAGLESVIGAMYVDGGLEPARRFVLAHMNEHIEAVVANQHTLNYKSILQQYAQREWSRTPAYEVLDEKGPDHAKAFEVCVLCNGQRYRSAWGSNKKEAEQLAARAALLTLDVIAEGDQNTANDA